MKKLNFLSNLWRLFRGSRKDDGSTRLRVVFDSFTCRLRVCPLKLVSVLAILLTLGVGNAWGATGTLTLTRSCFPSGELAYNFSDAWSATASTGQSISGYGDLYSTAKQTTLQTKNANVSTHYYNTTALPGAITKIEFDLASGTDRIYQIYLNTSSSISSLTGLTYVGKANEACALEISPAYGYKYFALQCIGGSSTLDQIVITYETGDFEFVQISSAGDLADGDDIIFVNQDEDYACGMKKGSSKRIPRAITTSNHKYTYVNSDSIQIFKVVKDGVSYGFRTGIGLIQNSGSGSNLTDGTDDCATPSSATLWSLTDVSSSVFSFCNGANTSNYLSFSGTSYFAAYASSSKPYIYKCKVATRSVTWMVNGTETTAGSPSNEVEKGSKVTTLPTTPSAPSACSTKVFVGWTDEEYDEDDDPPSVLFTTAAGAPTVDDDVTYYAVFADRDGSGEESTTNIFATSSLGSTNTVTSGYAVSAEATSKSGYYQDGGDVGTKRYVSVSKSSTATAMIASTPNSATVTAKLGGGETKDPLGNNVYAVWLDSKGDELGSPVQVTTKITNTTGSNFTANLPVANATSAYGVRIYHQKETGYNVRYYAISLSIKTGGYTYSNYATSCVASCAVPTDLTKGSFCSGTQKMPINWTSTAGEVDICYSSSSTTPGSTPGEGYTVVSGLTGSTSTANRDSLNVSALSADDYYCWVRSVCDADSKSAWTAITDNTFTIPGHTLTISPSPASSGTFDQTSGQTVVEGRTVSITATPASGYNFTSWAVSGTGSTLTSTSTNPTTFKMGTADATVTATFTAKTASAWEWTYNSGDIPNPLVLYVGINKQLDVSYTPADLLTSQKNYSVTKESSVAEGGKGGDYYKLRGAAGVTEDTESTVTFTLEDLSQTVNVIVKPQPCIHFVDNVHNESFADVLPTVVSYVATFTRQTPTHADFSGSTANTCEETHLHLVGWIYSEWGDVADYMAGTGDEPNKTALEAAKVGVAEGFPANTPCFFEPGDDIDTETWNGKTFYAVWAKAE